jgi:hypothetical protein
LVIHLEKHASDLASELGLSAVLTVSECSQICMR